MEKEPIIGEIRNGKELGYKNHQKMVRVLCPQCNKPRWTRISRQHKPCLSCAIHMSKGILALQEYPPEKIKKKGHAYVVLRTCSDCGREDWIVYQGKKTPRLCHSCAAFRKWEPGKSFITAEGYIRVNIHPSDFFYPMAVHGYVLEHRLVVAKAIGRCLHSWEIVHHKHDRYPAGSLEDKADNRYPENLSLELVNNHNQLTILEKLNRKLRQQISEFKKENRELKTKLNRSKLCQ